MLLGSGWGVPVPVDVTVPVGVSLGVGVGVGVRVGVPVGVGVAVAVGLPVGVGLWVGVPVGGVSRAKAQASFSFTPRNPVCSDRLGKAVEHARKGEAGIASPLREVREGLAAKAPTRRPGPGWRLPQAATSISA